MTYLMGSRFKGSEVLGSGLSMRVAGYAAGLQFVVRIALVLVLGNISNNASRIYVMEYEKGGPEDELNGRWNRSRIRNRKSKMGRVQNPIPEFLNRLIPQLLHLSLQRFAWLPALDRQHLLSVFR